MGLRGCEGWVLWIGVIDGSSAKVTAAYIPEQKAFSAGGGVCVMVESTALHKLNVLLHGSGLQLIAQVHSHPGEAYHSETDDEFPIATTVGAFSIVVPDFAVQPISIQNCAVYRLTDDCWSELNSTEISHIFQVLD